MALNASGPISLGGATTGQSINLELNQGALSVVALNDTNVRGLAGVSSGAITMPTDFWGKSGVSYWFGSYSNAAASDNYAPFTQDSSGNIVFQLTFPNRITVKINSTWTSILQEKLTTFTGSPQNNSTTAVFSDGTNFYTTNKVRFIYPSPRRDAGWLPKYDSDLNLIAENTFFVPSINYSFFFFGTALVKDGYIYTGASTNNQSGTFSVSLKIDPSTLGIVKAYVGPTAFGNLIFWSAVTSDDSGNFYFKGTYQPVSDNAVIAKFDSTFTFQYAKYTSDLAYQSSGGGDSLEWISGYLFFGVTGSFSPVSSPRLVKNDASNGNFHSGVEFNINVGAPYTVTITSVKKDASGNIYFLANTGGFNAFYLIKLDSNLNILWQRTFNTTSSPGGMQMKFANDNSAMIITWLTSSSPTSIFALKYPIDGSITGSYTVNSQTINIVASSFSATSFSATFPNSLTFTETSLIGTATLPAKTITTTSGSISTTSL